MKLSSWKASIQIYLLFSLILGGCSLENSSAPPPSDSETQSASEPAVIEAAALDVHGSGAFGSQCPHGFFSQPKPISLQFITEVHPRIEAVELNENLPAFTFQIDCIKMTLDVRKEGNPTELSTWEVMPDGNFYLTVNAGFAYLKRDFNQHINCQTPIVADMWGRIDCSDIDHPIMKIETLWWTGKNLNSLENTGPRPTPSPSISHSPAPFPQPSPSPSAPSVLPPSHSDPHPQPSLSPWPLPDHTPQPGPTFGPANPSPAPLPTPAPIPPIPFPSFRPSSSLNHSSNRSGRYALDTASKNFTFQKLTPIRRYESRKHTPHNLLQIPICEIPDKSYFHNMTIIQQCR